VIDSACTVDGYMSDCTRTFATGELPDQLAEAYDVTLRAQLAGLEAVKPGVSGRDADGAARAVIDEAGYGEAFGHGLGHGLGLMVHEAPRLSQESEDVLAAGNVVTVEPGIYLSGLGGIRIEDLVIVGSDGPEILTSFTKELVVVG
jgi:Xaa-Pro aminopeptidase